MSKYLRVTSVEVIQALPKKTKVTEGKVLYLKDGTKVYTKGTYVSKLLTMYKPKDTKRYPLEFTLCTYVNYSKVYPYNSKKRGWVNGHTEETA